MNIQSNVSIKSYNTFGIDVSAKYFVPFDTEENLIELLFEQRFRDEKRMILGGGSNILLTKNFDGLILKNDLKGIELTREDQEHYYIKVSAGENWHRFVIYCIENNYAGLENLSLIPGNVGASPMQNIGAYGIEIKDRFQELEAIEISSGKKCIFNKSDCRFGYRESIFKNKLKNQFIITSVTYQLLKKPEFNISYGAIEKELEDMGVSELSIKEISQAVINIRKSKLPDPAEIGNAGSFFKNPVVDAEKFNRLKELFPEIPAYPQADKSIKLAAGWLIEQCGWKGFREKDAGVHKNQALVLVNYGSATGSEIYDLSEKIILSVKERFDVSLEREVNLV
jgi:UDP-N-acetylmuramate dehydrogenase